MTADAPAPQYCVCFQEEEARENERMDVQLKRISTAAELTLYTPLGRIGVAMPVRQEMRHPRTPTSTYECQKG